MKKIMITIFMLVALPARAEETHIRCDAIRYSSIVWDNDNKKFISKIIPTAGDVTFIINVDEMYAKVKGYVRTKDLSILSALEDGHAVFLELDDFGEPILWLFAKYSDGIYLMQYKNNKKYYSHTVLYKCDE